MAFNIPDPLSDDFARFMMAQPQLAVFILNADIPFIYDDRIPTACTNGLRISLNRHFLESLATEHEEFVLAVFAHETVHVMMMHPLWLTMAKHNGGIQVTARMLAMIQRQNIRTKWKQGMTVPYINSLYQHALDYIINAGLQAFGMRMPYQVLLDPSLIPWVYSEDEAVGTLLGKYRIEPEDCPPNQGDQGQDGDGDGEGSSSPAQAKVPNMGDKPGQGASDLQTEDETATGDEPGQHAGDDERDGKPQPREHDRQRLKMVIEKTLQDLHKQRGVGTLDIARVIERLVPSDIDWRHHITVNVKAASGRGASSWSRIRRRSLAMGTVLPGQIARRAGHLGIVIDVSGSISKRELEQFAGCIVGIIKQVSPKLITVLYVDDAVKSSHEIIKLEDLYKVITKAKGGGGTDMRKAFRWFADHEVEPDGMVILTDGETPFPRSYHPAKRALWVITSPGVKAPDEAGTSVYMPLAASANAA